MDFQRSRIALSLSLLILACAPDGELVDPEDHDAELELVDGELEPLYEPLPDDDRVRAVEAGEGEVRCYTDAISSEPYELLDPTAEPATGMMATQAHGKLLALPLERIAFDTVVVGTVAETEVVQVFANPFDEPIEAVYVFPVHEHAAVDDYWLTIGERSIRGEIKTRADARATYERAKKTGHAAGLLEQERPNIFTQTVANIPPGQTIEVSIHVVQPLEQDQGRYSLVLPTVVGPRFIPSLDRAEQRADASRISSPLIPEGFVACAEVEIAVAIESGLRPRALRSTFHDVDIRREGDVAFIELDPDAGPVLANRDFILSWDLGDHDTRAALVAQPDDDHRGGYFTLTVQPPRIVADEDAAARELVFIVDSSGSMSGQPIDMARLLMHRVLRGMRADDAFNVLRFSDQASGLSPSLLAATPANIERGLAYVDELSGMGGTEMLAGVAAALALPHDAGRMRIMMFLTDGYIANEYEVFALIEDEIETARLFSLGLGAAPNRYLLDSMARAGRGVATYAGARADIDAVVDRFYESIETPVLTDVEVDWQDLAVTDVLPTAIPDLFAGQPLTLFGRYAGSASRQIVVRGRAGDRIVEFPVEFDVARADEIEGVSSIWARNKVDALLGYPTPVDPNAVDEDTREAVVELALDHRIMTHYTSFVAVDEQRVVERDGTIRTIRQPLELPTGARYEGFVGANEYSASDDPARFGERRGRTPRVRQATATIMGSLDRDIIRRVVRAHLDEVRDCYDGGLVKNPNLAGRVVIDMTIGAGGRIRAATVNSNSTGDAGVGRCIAKAVRTWTFPAPGSGEVRVSYPFNLSPG